MTAAAAVLDRAPATPAGRARGRVYYAVALAVVTVLGAGLRLYPLRSVWLDEAISVAQARLPYGQMLQQLLTNDLHPPLWGSLLWLDVRLLGYGPLAIRFPSLLAGTASIPLIYLLGRELYDRRAGMVAAVFMAVAPLGVWYSGEARMYALYPLWSIVALLGQARVFNRGGRSGWILFVAGSVGMFYTHYFAVLQLCAQHLVFAAAAAGWRIGGRRVRPLRRPWTWSMAATAVLCLPLVPFVFEQVVNGGRPGGAPASGTVSPYVVAANLVWSLWGYHSNGVMTRLVALWPIAMLLVLALLGKGRSWATTLLTAAVVVPVLGAFLISVRARTFFEVRYFVSILPALLLLLARAVTGWAASTAARVTAAAAVALTLLAGLADEQFDPANPRLYDYRTAFAYVDAQARPGDVLLYAPDYLAPVVQYYRPDMPSAGVDPDKPLPATPGRVLVFASFLDEPGTAQQAADARAALELRGRTVRQTLHWENVTLWILA